MQPECKAPHPPPKLSCEPGQASARAIFSQYLGYKDLVTNAVAFCIDHPLHPLRQSSTETLHVVVLVNIVADLTQAFAKLCRCLGPWGPRSLLRTQAAAVSCKSTGRGGATVGWWAGVAGGRGANQSWTCSCLSQTGECRCFDLRGLLFLTSGNIGNQHGPRKGSNAAPECGAKV